MVGAEHDRCVVPEIITIDRVENATKPVVDHRQFGSVVRPELHGLGLGKRPAADRVSAVRGPDHQLLIALVVVFERPRLGRVEGLVRIELVDKEEEAFVGPGIVVKPLRRCCHRLRPGEVGFLAEIGAGIVVAASKHSRRSR